MKSSPANDWFLTQALVVITCLFFRVQPAYSADSSPARSKATSVLIEEVQKQLASGAFKAAVDDLSELQIRLESLTDEESVAARAACLYQLGYCQIKVEDFSGAVDSFKRFIAEYPRHELAPVARFMVLEAYARQNDMTQMTRWLDELQRNGGFDELKRFFSDQKNADIRRTAVLALITGFAEQGDLKNLRVFLPFCDDTVLVDTGFNKALIAGGDQAFDKKEYVRALVLYRMVRMKNDLLPVYNRQIAALEAELAKSPEWVPLAERDRQAAERQAEQDRLEGLRQTVLFFEEFGYDQDLQLRIAQCYDAMQRQRLSLAIYRDVYSRFPEHRLAEQCRVSAFQALIALGDQEEAVGAGRDYLARYPQGRFEDEVTVSLMQLYLLRGELAAGGELGRRALAENPDRRMADQITYLLGITSLRLQNWAEALALFSDVKNRWPQSIYVQDADYWGGMCYLFDGRFADAAASFKAYLSNPAYDPKRFATDATYRLGVAQYGVEAYAEAEDTLKQFLILYPGDELVSEAYSMLGDLRGADGDLDTALTLYRTAIEKAVDGEQDSYAVFQSARTYELKQRYAEIIELMKDYVARRGTKAKLAEAGLWIGKACKAQGNRREALDVYLKTVVDYGNDPALAGIDQVQTQILDEFKNRSQDPDDLKYTTDRLAEELNLARGKNETALILRLASLLARLGGEAGRGVCIAELLNAKNSDAFSPLPLIILMESHTSQNDFESAERTAMEFKTRFPDSELLIDLLNGEASACLSAGQYEKTIALADEAIDRFEGDPRVSLSHKLRADALRLSGDWAQAIVSYQKIFSIRASHGALAPETLYWIGVCKREQGDVSKAFAFFQRVYVLYKGYPQWTAKAYEASADCLEKLGRHDEVILTLQEMVATPSIQNTPEVARAQAALQQLK